MFLSVRGVPDSVFQTVCAHCVWASNLSWFHMSTLLLGVPPFCFQLVVAGAFLLQTLLGVAGGGWSLGLLMIWPIQFSSFLLKCHLMDEWFHHLRLHPFPDLHVYILFGWCLFDQYILSTFSTCSWRTFPLKRIKFSCRGLCGLQCFQAVQEFWTLEFSICLTLGLVSRTGSVSLVIIGIVFLFETAAKLFTRRVGFTYPL